MVSVFLLLFGLLVAEDGLSVVMRWALGFYFIYYGPRFYYHVPLMNYFDNKIGLAFHFIVWSSILSQHMKWFHLVSRCY